MRQAQDPMSRVRCIIVQTMLIILQEAAKAGGKVLLDYFEKGVAASEKTSHHNLVTEADLASEKIICSTLLEAMTAAGYKKEEIGFIGEEKLRVSGKYTFAIDPLDGTNNFASGFDYFCVSIALFQDQNLLASVVYDPIRQEFYLAEKGKGASKTSKHSTRKLSVSDQDLKHTLLAVYFNPDPEIRAQQLTIYNKLYPKFRMIRANGSIALDRCKLAENIFGAVITSGGWIWDHAAAHLIVQESGGSTINWQGKKINFDLEKPSKQYPCITTHPKNMAKILKKFPNP
jgi:myo-inositol-1(or 4)-monophosphatase